MNNFKWFIFLSFVLMCQNGVANSEEKKPAQPAKAAPGWLVYENKVQELTSKIKSKEDSLQKLILEKNQLSPQSPRVKEVIGLIVKEHNELKKLAEDYKKNLSILNYRYPERNAQGNREYDRIEVKSVDQIESDLGISGKLNRNLQKMRSQYGGQVSPNGIQVQQKQPLEKSKKPESEPSIEDSGAIIINQ